VNGYTAVALIIVALTVPAAEFEIALKEELKRRPDWIVFVEADSELQWDVVANAVGIIRELHAKVVLLTPPPKDIPARSQRRSAYK
jgi:biopolymer transport protein ExbD